MANTPQYKELGPTLFGYLWEVEAKDAVITRFNNLTQGEKTGQSTPEIEIWECVHECLVGYWNLQTDPTKNEINNEDEVPISNCLLGDFVDKWRQIITIKPDGLIFYDHLLFNIQINDNTLTIPDIPDFQYKLKEHTNTRIIWEHISDADREPIIWRYLENEIVGAYSVKRGNSFSVLRTIENSKQRTQIFDNGVYTGLFMKGKRLMDHFGHVRYILIKIWNHELVWMNNDRCQIERWGKKEILSSVRYISSLHAIDEKSGIEMVRGIVDKSRDKMRRNKLSGLMTYHPEFQQVNQIIEGPRRRLEMLWHTISSDQRHSHIRLIRFQPFLRYGRKYKKWEMQYHEIWESKSVIE